MHICSNLNFLMLQNPTARHALVGTVIWTAELLTTYKSKCINIKQQVSQYLILALY